MTAKVAIMAKQQEPSTILSSMRHDLIHARLHFDVFKIYFHEDSRRKYRLAMLPFLNYFNCSIRAHLCAMIMALGRFFDEASNANGMTALISSEPSLENLDAPALLRAKDVWKKLLPLRHHSFAHSGAKTSIQRELDRAQTSVDEIEGLIQGCEELIRLWSRKLNNEVKFIGGVKSDLTAMLDALLDHRQIRLQRTPQKGRHRP